MKNRREKLEAIFEAAAETEQRVRAEGLLEIMQLQRAEELLDREQTLTGAGYLVQLLRTNPSNAVAAACLSDGEALWPAGDRSRAA
jgi:hypothetical protein